MNAHSVKWIGDKLEQNQKQMLTLDGDKSSLFSFLRFCKKVINLKVLFSVFSVFFHLHDNHNALLTILDLYHHMIKNSQVISAHI